MTDSFRLMAGLIVKGLHDSIIGTFKIYHMDKAQLAEQEHESLRKSTEQTSTLARRRAERLKHKEVKKDKEPRVLHRILQCCLWNGGIFWLSILAFNGVLLPCLHSITHLMFGGSSTHNVVWGWIAPIMTWTFSALWILPLFVLSKVVNSLWFQDIADAAYRRSRGRPQLIPSVSRIIADILFSLLIQALFLIQGMLVSLLPIPLIGQLVSMLHMCLLHSLYAFEYKWFNMGWEVNKRLMYIESNWPYFVGFGLPLALLTAMPSSIIVSGCVFSILFPLFIISGNEAEPLQATFDFPLRLFSPCVLISDAIFRHSIKKSQSATPSASSTPTKQISTSKR